MVRPGIHTKKVGEVIRFYLTCDFNHEHSRPQDVPGVVSPELDPVDLLLGMKVHGVDFLHGIHQLLFRVEVLL